MKNTEKDIIARLIGELDTANGMLMVAASKDETVRAALSKVSEVSFDLGLLID